MSDTVKEILNVRQGEETAEQREQMATEARRMLEEALAIPSKQWALIVAEPKELDQTVNFRLASVMTLPVAATTFGASLRSLAERMGVELPDISDDDLGGEVDVLEI